MLWVAFESGDSILDRLIRYASTRIGHAPRAPRPYCTHTFMVRAWDEDGAMRRLGLESVPLRGRNFDPAEKRGRRIHYYRLDASPEQEEAIWDAMLESTARLYSYTAIASALWYCWRGNAARWLDDHGAVFDCVESVSGAVRKAGMECCGLRPLSSLTPPIVETWATDHLVWADEDEVLG